MPNKRKISIHLVITAEALPKSISAGCLADIIASTTERFNPTFHIEAAVTKVHEWQKKGKKV